MPFTTNRLLSVQATGTNAGTWGAGTADSLNEGVMQILDSNLGGITTLTPGSTTPQNLSQTQANNGLLHISGALLASIVVQPDTGVTMSGFFYFENVTSGNFTVTLTNSAGSVVLPQGRRGTFWIDTTYGPRIMSIGGSTIADSLPTGTVIPFYNTTVPTGWTVVSSVNDYALKVVSSNGGVTAGTVAYSTLFGRTAVDGFVLTTNEIPAHSHGIVTSGGGTPVVGSGSNTTPGGGGTTVPSAITNLVVQNTGSGASHTHAIDMRVQTASVLLGTRN